MSSVNRNKCYGLSVFVLVLVLVWFFKWNLPTSDDGEEKTLKFLNERASGIVGADPLIAPGFIIPEGLTGEGQVVGLADSGLSTGRLEDLHPDLKNKPGQKPKVIMLKSWVGRQLPDDPVGHGTHMAATIAGTGAASSGKYAGIAPGATLYFQGILNSQGKLAPPSNLSMLYKPAYDASVRIHIDGWGGTPNAYLSSAAQTDSFIRSYPDFLVVFGAGNDGSAKGSITSEANSKNSLVVGASEGVRPGFGPDTDNATELAGFSSRGPTADGRIKPDLVAPGSGIVSARSPLVESNFTANPQYTRMQGTSMATAVTGGAAALLREYLQKEESISSPSAALLKAAFINGAAPLPDEGTGFGRLDLAATILAFKENAFSFVDEGTAVENGKSLTYNVQVSESNRPLKATIAWTDPAAPAGAAKTLVNDLDLVVLGPDGKKYLGNDFKGQGHKDDKNNVEQVVIPSPAPGIYTIQINGTAIKKAAALGTLLQQDFAMVYGQPLVKKTVVSVDTSARRLQLTGDTSISFPQSGKNALGRRLTGWDISRVLPGEDVYLGSDNQLLYIAGETWQNNAAQVLPLPKGSLFLDANPANRDGGYTLDPHAVSITMNGDAVDNPDKIPTGAEVFASVNPSAASLWSVRAGLRVEEGFVKDIDQTNHLVYLFGKAEPYKLAESAAFSFTDTVVGGSPADQPFGAPVRGSLQDLAPGMPVRLLITPSTTEVGFVIVKREVAVGTVTGVSSGRIDLEEGGSYQLMPNAPASYDGMPLKLEQIKPESHATLILLDGQVLSAAASSRVTYGQVIYFNRERGSLYLMDFNNRMRMLKVSQETTYFRWRQPGDLSSLSPGDWVRTTLIPEQADEITRIDAVEANSEKTGVVDSYAQNTRKLTLASGQTLQVSSKTMITKEGYPVKVEDLVKGEKVDLASLGMPGKDTEVLASIEAHTKTGVKAPTLEAYGRSDGTNLVVSGVTSGNQIYIYPEDGSPVPLAPDNQGYYEKEFPLPSGNSVQVVAVDRRTGGVNGKFINIAQVGKYTDLKGHWAAKEIAALTDEGILAGYPGNKFMPEKPVSRAEFTVMLVRALKWKGDSEQAQFKDTLPPWAALSIIEAVSRGAVSGYPDGRFYPNKVLTRAEAAAILSRAYEANKANEKSNNQRDSVFKDWKNVRPWSRESVLTVSKAGLMGGYPGGYFYPDKQLTRAEAVAIINRLKLKAG